MGCRNPMSADQSEETLECRKRRVLNVVCPGVAILKSAARIAALIPDPGELCRCSYGEYRYSDPRIPAGWFPNPGIRPRSSSAAGDLSDSTDLACVEHSGSVASNNRQSSPAPRRTTTRMFTSSAEVRMAEVRVGPTRRSYCADRDWGRDSDRSGRFFPTVRGVPNIPEAALTSILSPQSLMEHRGTLTKSTPFVLKSSGGLTTTSNGLCFSFLKAKPHPVSVGRCSRM